MPREKFGVISMGAGKKYNSEFNHIQELREMVKMLRKQHTDLPVMVWTAPLREVPGAIVHSIPDLVGPHWWKKYVNAKDVPWGGKFRIINGFKLLALRGALECFETVLWLDGEVRVLKKLNEILNPKEPFDIAMARDYSHKKGNCDWWNGGVIVVRNTPGGHAVIEDAWKRWCNEKRLSEQAMISRSIKQLSKEKKIIFRELNNRVWNVRPDLASSMKPDAKRRAAILHTRGHPLTGDERVWS